jgi:DNA-binding GntR family transcriptional regulator/DNA-binding LacI/PurR family transcriptional regulator
MAQEGTLGVRGYQTVKVAKEYIAQRLDQARQAGASRAPSVRTLCRDGRFSLATCRKAERMLAAEGRCTVVPGRGVFVMPSPPAVHPRLTLLTVEPRPDIRLPRWEIVRRRISGDILTRTYAPGSLLPISKALCVRYGTTHVTLVTALKSLVSAGQLFEQGKRYRVFAPARHTARSTIVLIAHGSTMAKLIGYAPRSEQHVRHLEELCSKHNLHLEHIAFTDVVNWTSRARSVLGGSSRNPAVGCLFWVVSLTRQDIDRAVERLIPIGKPVSVLDETGKVPLPSTMLSSPQFRVFAMAYSDMPGRQVGEYLVSHGHRAVAFFASSREDLWWQNRARGLEYCLRRNGDGVLRTYGLKQLRYNDANTTVETTEPYRALIAIARQFTTRLKIPSAVNPFRIRSEREAEDLVRMELFRDELQGQMREALRCRGTTARVAANDTIAFVLLDFLAREHVDVPRALSVMGFDDVSGSYNVGLSTYNFNVPAVVDAMLEHVLGGVRSIVVKDRKVIEIPGYIVERRTSGSARR